MKLICAGALLLLSLPTFASNSVVCRVAQLYTTNAFEEALSMDEYPMVSVAQVGRTLRVKVGALQEFNSSLGDKIILKAKGANTLVTASHKNSPSKVFIELDLSGIAQRIGLVSFQQDGRHKIQKVALLNCN